MIKKYSQSDIKTSLRADELEDDQTDYSIAEIGQIIALSLKKAKHHIRFGEYRSAMIQTTKAAYWIESLNRAIDELDSMIEAENIIPRSKQDVCDPPPSAVK